MSVSEVFPDLRSLLGYLNPSSDFPPVGEPRALEGPVLDPDLVSSWLRSTRGLPVRQGSPWRTSTGTGTPDRYPGRGGGWVGYSTPLTPVVSRDEVRTQRAWGPVAPSPNPWSLRTRRPVVGSVLRTLSPQPGSEK